MVNGGGSVSVRSTLALSVPNGWDLNEEQAVVFALDCRYLGKGPPEREWGHSLT